MRFFARLCCAAAMVLAVVGCSREERTEEKAKPVEVVKIPTPKRTVRVGDTRPTAALPAHTSAAAAPTEAAPSPAPTAAPPPEAAAPTRAPEAAPSPEEVVQRGVVGRGVDLHVGPAEDSRVRGTFEGRTDVEVVATEGEWSRVRAPVIGGGFVEGWVRSASVLSPEEAAKVAKAPPPAAPVEKKPPAPTEKKPAAPPGKKPAVVKAPGDKGPDDILLKPIAGTAKKRPATPFTHKAHYDDYSIKCETCHHPVKARGGEVGSYSCSAAGCHTAGECDGRVVAKKNRACPFFEDAYHIQCIECHKRDGGPTKCAECHSG